jgi:hypothetical protein
MLSLNFALMPLSESDKWCLLTMLLVLMLCIMSENYFSHKYMQSQALVPEGRVAEVDIESEATSLSEGHLVSFTQLCLYSFCLDRQVHLGELQDGDQPLTLCP